MIRKQPETYEIGVLAFDDWWSWFNPDMSTTSDYPITREEYARREAAGTPERRGTAPRRGSGSAGDVA